MTKADGRARLPLTAVLVRRQRVDIGDVSRKGCRFEGPEPLAVGQIGMLTVWIEGELHVELFRVSRSAALLGSDRRYEAGVEFLPMPAEVPSLHDVAALLDQSHSA